MELKATLDHVLPIAVVKCRWFLSPEKVTLFRSVNDGAILLPQKPKENATTRKALLSTPPLCLKLSAERATPKVIFSHCAKLSDF